jgi:hypothetical protein
MTQLEIITNWLEGYEAGEYSLTIASLRELLNTENGECADVAESHNPSRFRGGYAEGLIEGNPMVNIGNEIRERNE